MNNAQHLLDLAEGQVLMLCASRIAPSQRLQASQDASLSTAAECVDGIKRHHRKQAEAPNADPL